MKKEMILPKVQKTYAAPLLYCMNADFNAMPVYISVHQSKKKYDIKREQKWIKKRMKR